MNNKPTSHGKNEGKSERKQFTGQRKRKSNFMLENDIAADS